MSARVIFLLLLGSGLVIGVVGYRSRQDHAKRCAAAVAQLAEFETGIAREQRELSELGAALRSVQERIDLLEAEREVRRRFGPPPAEIWAQRIEKLRRRLEQTGALHPEHAWLEPKDWINAAVQVEGISDREFDRFKVSLRRIAHFRVAQAIQKALRGYVERSGGELPTKIGQLAPFLPPTASDAVLSNFVITRTGPLGDGKEPVIEGKIDAYSLTISSELVQSRISGKDLQVLDEAQLSEFGTGAQAAFSELVTVMKGTFARMRETVGDALSDEETAGFRAAMKTAVKEYRARTGKPPTSLFDLREASPVFRTFAHRLRPVFAELEYVFEHGGAAPETPAKLQRYLDAMSVERVMRRLTITSAADGESGTIEFNVRY